AVSSCRQEAGAEGRARAAPPLSPADADRAGRRREDPPRGSGGGRGDGRIFGRRLVRLPGGAQRSRPGLPTIASTVDGGSELAEGLGDKRPLLVLDNCEQLLPGIAMKG